jgi:hypothetical protein
MAGRQWIRVASTIFALTSIALTMFVAEACGQQTPAPDLPSCYWQDALNGVFCDRALTIRGSLTTHTLDWSSQTFHSGGNIGSITEHDSYRASWLDSLGALDFAPYSWLKLSVDAGFESLRNEDDYFFTTKIGVRNPGPGEKVLHATDWSNGSAEANVMLFDSGPGDARFIFHVFAGAGLVPGEGDAGAQSRLNTGAEAGARLALSSVLALNAEAALSFDHFSGLSANALFPSARALLSYDSGGVAIGPVYDGAVLTSESGGIAGRRQSEQVGGEALIQPFLALNDAILRGVLVEAKAEHTVGPATFETAAGASGASYSAAVLFNFHF